MKVKTLQHFKSVADFALHYGVVLPKPRQDWRLIAEPPVGSIVGIPSSQGVAVATNGILCAIVQGKQVFYGHIDFFVTDECENEPPKTLRERLTKKAPSKPKVTIAEFV